MAKLLKASKGIWKGRQRKKPGRMTKWLAWEVDWGKRKYLGSNPMVWARNPASMQERARKWHWATHNGLTKAGVKWVNKKEEDGIHINGQGYVMRTPKSMSVEEIDLCDRLNLWSGIKKSKRNGVKEHFLVIAKKYGKVPDGFLVRHLNGNKEDNSPDNLLIGTHKENTMDHRTAVAAMMYWRERALIAEGRDVVDSLRFTPDMVKSGHALKQIEIMLKGKREDKS